MEWSEITKDWAVWSERIRHRFPRVETGAMERVRHDRPKFEAYLADTHNLSLNEAHEEIDDFLYIETLARELGHQGTQLSP